MFLLFISIVLNVFCLVCSGGYPIEDTIDRILIAEDENTYAFECEKAVELLSTDAPYDRFDYKEVLRFIGRNLYTSYICNSRKSFVERTGADYGTNGMAFSDVLPYFDAFKLFPKSKEMTLSTVETMLDYVYYGHDYLYAYDLDLETVQNLLQKRLNQLVDVSVITSHGSVYPIRDLLHALAIYYNKTKTTKKYIFASRQRDGGGSFQKMTGFEYDRLNRHHFTKTNADITSESYFFGIFIHELTHQLMEVLFQNDSNPFGPVDYVALEAFMKCAEKLEKNADSLGGTDYLDVYVGPEPVTTAGWILVVREQYDVELREAELVVKLCEAIGRGAYQKSEEVRQLLSPLAEYWGEYIDPAIKAYISENSEYDKFITVSTKCNLVGD